MRRAIDRNAERTERQRLGYVPPEPAGESGAHQEGADVTVENLGLLAFAASKSGTVHALEVTAIDETTGQPTEVRDHTLCGADAANMTTAPDATEPTCANCLRKLAASDGGDN